MQTRIRPAQRRRLRRGFTLVEILAVVMILGILATIIGVKIAGAGEKTRINTTRIQIKNIRTAIAAYELALGKFPTSLEELVIEGDANWPGPFLDSETVPKDGWGGDFKYEIIGKRYRVTSAAKDGQFGSPDDIWE